MPKMKTNRGAAKRFKKTGTGKFKRRRSFHQHIFTSKTAKRKRFLRDADTVAAADQRRVREMLPYA